MNQDLGSGMRALVEDGLRLMDAPATGTGVHFEHLEWIDASTKPDSDITVLCWDGDTPYFCGWWDDALKTWVDGSTGGAVEGVTHWSEPAGPR